MSSYSIQECLICLWCLRFALGLITSIFEHISETEFCFIPICLTRHFARTFMGAETKGEFLSSLIQNPFYGIYIG